MKKEERQQRVIARGEGSNHSHVITGDKVRVYQKSGETFIEVGEDSNAVLKHLMETEWLNGKEVWTKEHSDISLKGLPKQVRHGDCFLELIDQKGTYKYIPQLEYDPYNEIIRKVID